MYAKHNFNIEHEQKVNFRKAASARDIEAAYKMGKNWYKDYIAAGDFALDYASISDLEDAAKDGDLVIATSDNKYAGFAELKRCNGKVVINVVYVLPKFRRMGIAKALYQHLINQCEATEIELTFKRVLDRIDYWKSLGFASVKSLEGYYRLRDLCRLSTSGFESRLLSVALNKSDIQNYRNTQGRTVSLDVKPLDFLKFTNF